MPALGGEAHLEDHLEAHLEDHLETHLEIEIMQAFTTQPSWATGGVAFTQQPAVAIQDAGGNAVTSSAAVTLSKNSGPGALSGTLAVGA